MTNISLNMIVKNEEAYLPRCLESIRGLFSEMVIVDTGSTDSTREIATSFGAKVYDFEWCDDFAAARNYALANSSAEWIFTLDAGNYLLEDNRNKLKDFFNQIPPKNIVYSFPTRRHMHLEFNIGGNLHYRLFQNNGIHVWKRPIHERLHDSFNESGAERKYIDIPVELERILSMEELVEKEEYYTSLLLKQIKRDPNDIDTLFELARSHHIMRRFKEAVDYWERYYDLAMPHPIIHQVTVYYYCEDLIYSGNLPKGKEIIKKARELYPKNCLFLFLEANLFESEGKTADAIQCFKHIPELIEEEDTETTFTDPLAMQQTAKRRLEFLGGCS